MMKTPLTRLAILAFFLTSAQSFAVEYQSPRTLALGGAGRASPWLTDSIYLNPAYGSFVAAYSVSAGYNWFDQGRNYNASVQDARDELIQAGVGYTKREQNAAVNIGASKQLVKQLGFGLGSKFLIDNNTSKFTGDMTFSTAYIALQWVYASIIIDNLIQSPAGLDRNLYRTFFVAFKFIPTKEVAFYVDPLYSPNYHAGHNTGFSAGLELAALADFYLRAGKFVNGEVSYLNTRGDGFGLGVGWVGPRINFDYAFSRVTQTDSGVGLTTSHSISATLFL